MTDSMQQMALDTLGAYFGYTSFRPGQDRMVDAILAGRDALGVMPTGAGKSICYQVPALMLPGITFVVSPLLSLMEDQTRALLAAGARPSYLNSSLTPAQQNTVLKRAREGRYQLMYVAPERLLEPRFLAFAQEAAADGGIGVPLVAIDEAHCVSQWGQDFRPAYLQIREFIDSLPQRPIVAAFTATATERVRADIQQMLGLRDPATVVTGFDRKNLYFGCEEMGDKAKAAWVRDYVIAHSSESGIVYCSTRKTVDALAGELVEALGPSGIRVGRYHAGMGNDARRQSQRAFIDDDIQVMVATNAFGMGIDKPDVRLVVHMDVPDSLEAYFQEAGRGGRDGQVAYGVLLTDGEDAKRLSMHLTQAFPDRTYIRRVYADLASFFQIAEGEAEGRTFDFNMERFCHVFKHFPVLLVSALNLLTQAGYIHFSLEDENSSRVIFLVRRDELYGIDYLNSAEERVLNIIMRNTCGIFADYVPVDEERLAEKCGMTREQVYNHLRHLTQLRVLNYVPHKDTPQITYTCRRIDADQVQIMPDIYEVRRDQYRTRIDAMIRYFTETDMCRSRFLLHYFDDDGPDCGYCDVCIAREEETASMPQSQQVDEAAHHVMTVVEAGRTYPLAYFKESGFAHGVLLQALARLQHEGRITFDGVNIVVG